MSVSAALAKYRELVTAHAKVPNGIVEAWLTEAATALDSSKFGTRYTSALVWWAAHHVQTSPGVPGLCNDDTTASVGTLTHKTETKGEGAERKSLTRSWSGPASSGNADDDALRTTEYGKRFLALRGSRAAGGPRVIRPGC